jgi:radical SAM protein with 4Fe4S-binding SPASM domain
VLQLRRPLNLRKRLNVRHRIRSFLARFDLVNTFHQVFIEPCFNYCNLRCPYCPVGQGLQLRDAPSGMMRLPMFKQIWDKSFRRYTGRVALYNWGEPFLNPDLPDMVRYVKQHSRARLLLNSNFSWRHDDRLLDILACLDEDAIVISCDGFSQETCEKYRVGVDFSLVMHNVEWINVHRKPQTQLHWQYLKFPWNHDEIEQAEAYCKARDIIFRVGTGGIADSYPILPSPRTSQPDRSRCEFFRGALSINFDGEVYPCCSYYGPASYSLGNAATTGIHDIFSRGRGRDMLEYLALRSEGDDRLFCKHCVERNLGVVESWK